MGEWVIGTTIGDLKRLSSGSIPPFPTKNQRVCGGCFLVREITPKRVRVSGFRGLGFGV